MLWILLLGCAALVGLLLWQLGQFVWQRRQVAARMRARDELLRNRERLERLEAGGSPEHPIDVSSASVVESRAAATDCAMCDASSVGVETHEADVSYAERIRSVGVVCRRCGHRRTLYFRLTGSVEN